MVGWKSLQSGRDVILAEGFGHYRGEVACLSGSLEYILGFALRIRKILETSVTVAKNARHSSF